MIEQAKQAEHYRHVDATRLWSTIQAEARAAAQAHPILGDYYQANILQHADFQETLAYLLASKLCDDPIRRQYWRETFLGVLQENPHIGAAAMKDLQCQLQSNASVKDHFSPLLYFGGFQALQAHRLAHAYWNKGQYFMANYIQGQAIRQFAVDIHPAAQIGAGIFVDHAIGIVIGETSVVESDVTIFQNVTLGGVGKGSGDRHPKIRRGAFIGSSAIILGSIEVGAGAKVAAGAVVVKSVPPYSTVVGPEAREVTRS